MHDNSILLGRPFLQTSRTQINLYGGTLTMGFGGEVIKFHTCDDMRFSANVNNSCALK